MHVFPLFTGFFHSSCTEDQWVGYVDWFTSWDWCVSSFYKLHSLINFFRIYRTLGIGETIIVSSSAHSNICPWLIWSNDHRIGSGWVLQVCSWHNWCMPDADPWSNSCLANLGVVASICLPYLPFGNIVPLGTHDAEYTLELQLQLHWMALDMLVEDGPSVEILTQSRFVMWLVELPSQGDHAVLRLNLTGWLTLLLELCDEFRRWFFSWWPPHIFLLYWRGICCKYIQVWKPSLFFGVTKFGVLEFLKSYGWVT